jgi:hypothetical protein
MILRVKKLSKQVTESDLKKLFEPFSVIKVELKRSGDGDPFAFVEVPDNMAKKAVEKLNNRYLKGKNISVQIKDDSTTGSQQKKEDSQPYKAFPYSFCVRKTEKKALCQFHDSLLPGHYDVAFEIEWETLTPTALNPVLDEKEQSSWPKNDDNEYSGYNRRWLSVDGRLVISPFTVKSAIANGFANLLGGCYRVNTKIEGHKSGVSKGEYLYQGAYKRYRVAMDGSSKPGIVRSIKTLENGDKEITIQPVKEFYLDCDPPHAFKNIKQGDEVCARIVKKRGHKPPIIELTRNSNCEKVKYHGEVRYGCSQNLHPRHKHRFYVEQGNEVSGRIPAVNFKTKEELKKVVSIGGAGPNDRPTEWYQDLNDIKVGSFVYYETFGGKVTNIGKNFLFKAVFYHEDTVPEANSECIDLGGALCPRCRMFGVTDEAGDEKSDGKEAIGYKGRFKSSALISTIKVKEHMSPDFVRVKDPNIKDKIPLKVWVNEKTGARVATQEFLPISGPPKPNRRDVDGYFNKQTGELKGAKYYLHGKLNTARNIWGVDQREDYTHRLRNYAMVVEPGLSFKGTVGAENCNLEEIAAFLILLQTGFLNHGFKIGLGKAFGMGSVKSTIRKVWIRKSDDYENWYIVENEGDDNRFLSSLESHIKGITEEFKRLKEVTQLSADILNRINEREKRILRYPEKGLNYWKEAWQGSRPR